LVNLCRFCAVVMAVAVEPIATCPLPIASRYAAAVAVVLRLDQVLSELWSNSRPMR
jgi:hypothetical protein